MCGMNKLFLSLPCFFLFLKFRNKNKFERWPFCVKISMLWWLCVLLKLINTNTIRGLRERATKSRGANINKNYKKKIE